jgi:hypothetical protein
MDPRLGWMSPGEGGRTSRVTPVLRWEASQSEVISFRISTVRTAAGIATGDGMLWVGVRGAESAHRGGTLRVVSLGFLMDSIDPAIAYVADSWSLLWRTNDGLLGFKRVAGV